jgi:RNA polymerase sigma-70 factor, ECF subfamily
MQHRPHSDLGDPETVSGTCRTFVTDAVTSCAGVHARVSAACRGLSPGRDVSPASVPSPPRELCVARDLPPPRDAAADLSDPEAFSAAYRQHAPGARAAAISVLRDGEAAEDVVQDVFCAIWMRPEVYRPERGSLSTFVHLMARSRALDRLRASAAAAAALRRDALEARARPRAGEPTSEEVIRRDSARSILSALDGLPDGQRAAVLLHHVGGLSDGELARAMHVPLGTAKSRIRLGTRRARAVVQDGLAA